MTLEAAPLEAALTPRERDQVQEYFLRRWLADRWPPAGRRKHDQPLPAAVAARGPEQLDRYCRWSTAAAKG